MASKIEYKASVFKDLKHIDKKAAKRVLDSLEKALSEDPNSGKPLHGQFKGLFKFVVGKYRVIYTKTNDGVLILKIRHREKVYK
ncbi:MAG: type II toxin-antitoxin system RelE/ParE family toxin [Candidatus Undinarchaeales archaeon]|nr:type II toxin-antitoxin system RelE/ParE family toxin [Candidatus Undinarchaeales archaeon]MDP7492599.1 type II toxin-antitoxin system RelE/ParE family toxin [Candidatus Undinarchaeales archaeon]